MGLGASKSNKKSSNGSSNHTPKTSNLSTSGTAPPKASGGWSRLRRALSLSRARTKAIEAKTEADRDQDISDWWPQVGEYIEAQCKDWSTFYGGEIKRIIGKGATTSYVVLFDDGERIVGVQRGEMRRPRKNKSGGYGDVKSRKMRAESTAKKQTGTFRLDDRVAARIPGWERAYEGTVARINADNTYVVKFDDGEVISNVKPTEMIPFTDKILFDEEDEHGGGSLEDFEEAVSGDDEEEEDDDDEYDDSDNHSENHLEENKIEKNLKASTEKETVNSDNKETSKTPEKKPLKSALKISTASIPDDDNSKPTPKPTTPTATTPTGGVERRRSLKSEQIPPWIAPKARVELKLPGWHKWYSGMIEAVDAKGVSKVILDDGEIRVGIMPSFLRRERVLAFDESEALEQEAADAEKDIVTPHPPNTGLAAHQRHGSARAFSIVSGLSMISEFESMDHNSFKDSPIAEEYSIGMRIEAKCLDWSKYYPGRIEKINRDGTFWVNFDDGDVIKNVNPGQMRVPQATRKAFTPPTRRFSLGSATAGTLNVGDYVEAQVTGWRKAYPGTIEKINSDGTYKILFDDGEVVHHVKPGEIREQNRYRAETVASELQGPVGVNPSNLVYVEEERVAARLPGWRKYWPGNICKVRADNTYDISFDDGERYHKVEPQYIKKVEPGSIFWAEKLKVPGAEKYEAGEVVVARCRGWQRAVKGVVEKDNGNGTYVINFVDGDRHLAVSWHEMKRYVKVKPIPVANAPPPSSSTTNGRASKTEQRPLSVGKAAPPPGPPPGKGKRKSVKNNRRDSDNDSKPSI